MVKIIAEVGSNIKSESDARRAVHLAKAVGATAVKFQMYTSYELYGFGPEDLAHGVDPDWLPGLKDKALGDGIELMCTAFSPEGYDLIDSYVDTHKVASAEMTHVRILEKLKNLGKPIILSTGASGHKDILDALKVLGSTDTTLMYCVSAYPAQNVDLDVIGLIRDQYGLPVGFSDHTLDLGIPADAYRLHGAVVVEKHFNPFDYTDTPDASHSLSIDDFAEMVRRMKGDHVSRIGYTKEESDMVLQHNRRLVVTRDMSEGEALIEGKNFGIYRSMMTDTHGYSPFLIGKVLGRCVKRNMEQGQSIGPGDI